MFYNIISELGDLIIKLGEKLRVTLDIIRSATNARLPSIYIQFDPELEVQLWRLGFKLRTYKHPLLGYCTQVS